MRVRSLLSTLYMHSRTLAVLLAVALLACRGKSDDNQNAPPSEAQLAVLAARVPPGSLKQLPWLLGTFRGTGAGSTPQEAFFERNSLLDDSTLIVLSFHDSTLTEADTTRYELRRDSLTNTGDGRYIATAFSADSVTFGPLADVRNFFTWRRGDDSSWFAFIFPFGNSRDVRAFRMTRIKR
jgi:hypothetical protein